MTTPVEGNLWYRVTNQIKELLVHDAQDILSLFFIVSKQSRSDAKMFGFVL